MQLTMLLSVVFIAMFGSVYCTSDVSHPTPVYVVKGGEAVLQCVFDSGYLKWHVYSGGRFDIIANGSDVKYISKYSTSKNPLTGLYYRLHILNVGESDVMKYRCERSVNAMDQQFYLYLDLLEPQELSGLYGGVIGGVVGVLIILVIIIGILFFMNKKGLFDGRDQTKSNRNDTTAADNPTNNDAYEDIEGATSNQRKRDPRNKRVETPSTNTYEVLGMKDTANTYADLSSRREQQQSLPITEHYEALGKQDTHNVYDCIKNKEESENKDTSI